LTFPFNPFPVTKHGLLDQPAAARLVLRDWSRGRFPWYTTPPPCAPSSDAEDRRWDKDEDVLAALRTKKEMRRETTGLVAFDWGAVDERRIEIEEPWVGADEHEGEDQHEKQEVEGNAQEEDEQEDEEQDSPGDESAEDDEMDASPAPVIASRMKRKRAREEMPSPPTPKKKVAFAADPKGTKQARRGR
jgi:nuclear GTP-binding protein